MSTLVRELVELHVGTIEVTSTVNKVSLNLIDIINSAIATVELTAKAKSISITTDFEPDVVVSADAKGLQQIVGNLLSNAIKFTPQAGQITVKLINSQ